MSAALQSRKSTATDADAFLFRIDALLPAIQERATEVERQGMISHQVIGWLTEADVFRAMQPRQWGGLELDFIFRGQGRALADAFVPEYRTHSSTQVHERTDPGRTVNDRPLYRLPWSAVFPYAIASPAIGAATGALELFIENSRERVSVAGGRTVSASPGLHLRLAELLTEVEAARIRLAMTWQDFHARVTRGEGDPLCDAHPMPL